MASEERKIILSERLRVAAKGQKEREESKVIVKEIVNMGITQKQIMYIIRNLALELEDACVMKRIYDIIQEEIGRKTIIVPRI